MNVLHLAAGSLSGGGGATRGALWLHQGLRSLGIDSRFLSTDPKAEGEGIVSIARPAWRDGLRRLRSRMDQVPLWRYPRRGDEIFSPAWVGYDFTRHPLYRRADILHLHWINAGFVSIERLARVDKPIVWTMRDMWPFTGGCHYALGCEKYRAGCGACPQLGSSAKNDLSRRIVRRKERFLPRNLHLVAISRWLADCARSSEVFHDADIRTIANCVDTEAFQPADRSAARSRLGLPADVPIVLTGSFRDSESYKGGQFLPAIASLCAERGWLHCSFGHGSAGSQDTGPSRHLGYIADNMTLRDIYSAADVFVLTSTQDAFAKTAAESVCSGTPVVAFDATGPRDIVEVGRNGYLATPYETESLLSMIVRTIDERGLWATLAAEISGKARRDFSPERAARRYRDLYKEILGQ